MTRSGIRRSCPKVTCQLLLDKRSNLLRKPILEYCLTFKHRRRASIPFSPYNKVNFAGEVPWLCIFHTLLRRHIRYFFLRRIPQGKPMLYVPHYSRERERGKGWKRKQLTSSGISSLCFEPPPSLLLPLHFCGASYSLSLSPLPVVDGRREGFSRRGSWGRGDSSLPFPRKMPNKINGSHPDRKRERGKKEGLLQVIIYS